MRKDLYTNGSVDIPRISKGRSFFDLSHSSHIDMNIGILYPIDQVIQIIPGDTFDMSHRLNIRMTNPPKTPTMDQLVLDIYYFYVPNRIVWSDWDNFITNYNASSYNSNWSGSFPAFDISHTATATHAALNHSVLDYQGYGALNALGISGATEFNPNAMPVRGYYEIWNEYFRYEPLQNKVLVTKGSSFTTYVIPNTANYYDATSDTGYSTYFQTYSAQECHGLTLMPVNRLPGYFSRSLPTPVNGSDVSILNQVQIGTSTSPVQFYFGSTGANNSNLIMSTVSPSGGTAKADDEILNYISGNLVSTDNSIRALSQAFALNKFLYLDNLYGKRITEWTYGHFGVNVPDSRVQRPEFLSKKRIYININQVVQSSSTDTTSPQGNAGAWSQTFDASSDFTKSFTEFGFLHSLGCIRVLNHTYAQGIDKFWSYRTRYDYPLPEFVNVGDQEVKRYEMAVVTPNLAIQTWGYQERYAEAKMIPSRVAGYMRPQIANSLALWTYTDYYSGSQPSLSATWMLEPHANFNNTLYISDTTAPSFILDYVADLKAYRTLPYHSIPGGLTGSW